MKRALVLSLALVLGLGIAGFTQGEIHGEWDTTITIAPGALVLGYPTPADFFDFATTLQIDYSVGGWTFTSISGLSNAGWDSQSFAADGAFGAFQITSTAVFTTGITLAVGFTSLDVGVDYTFGAVAITIGVTLVPGDLTLVVGGTASTGLVDITVDLTFGDPDSDPAACDLDWSGAIITVGFPFNCADVTASIEFDCDGFVEACFAASDIEIPGMPWVTVGVEVCFELETKSLALTPEVSFGDGACFTLFIEQDVTPGGVSAVDGSMALAIISELSIAGISIEAEFLGTSFYGVSYWGTGAAKPEILGDYWEMYQISTGDVAGSCCGPFNFDVAVFFDAGGALLFDVAAFEANFSYDFGEAFTFSMGLVYDAALGLTEWEIGFTVTW